MPFPLIYRLKLQNLTTLTTLRLLQVMLMMYLQACVLSVNMLRLFTVIPSPTATENRDDFPLSPYNLIYMAKVAQGLTRWGGSLPPQH